MKQSPDKTGFNDSRYEKTLVLKSIRPREDWPRKVDSRGRIRKICVLDTETTGIDVARHLVIEICAATVLVDEIGRVVGIQSIGDALQDPGRPLPSEIVELTGLNDADLEGQRIETDRLISFIEHCEAVVAFNSGFDRPHVEKLLPALRPMPWGCAMADVPWRNLGFEPGPQGYLLMQTGRYNPSAHRAKDDVLALIELLDHVCEDSESVMAKVLAAIEAPAWRFEASNAAYDYKDDLRERRYRWIAERTHRLWHKHVRPSEFRDEYRWYKRTICKRPVVVPLPASERYRANDTWQPTRPRITTPSWLK